MAKRQYKVRPTTLNLRKNLPRSEALCLLVAPEMDVAVRAMALYSERSITAVVRRAIEKAHRDDKAYQAVKAYTKALTRPRYQEMKAQMMDESLAPEDRIPTEILQILKEYDE